MTVRSNPPGAVVYVSGHEIGTTPVSHNFTYYGTREIRLVKDGYETLTVMQPNRVAWYQIPPLDFISEVLVPGEIRDHRTFDFQMVPQKVVPTEEVLQRAEQLRGRSHSAGLMRSWPSTGGTLTPPVPTTEAVSTPQTQPSGAMPLHALPPGGWSR